MLLVLRSPFETSTSNVDPGFHRLFFKKKNSVDKKWLGLHPSRPKKGPSKWTKNYVYIYMYIIFENSIYFWFSFLFRKQHIVCAKNNVFNSCLVRPSRGLKHGWKKATIWHAEDDLTIKSLWWISQPCLMKAGAGSSSLVNQQWAKSSRNVSQRLIRHN